MFINGVEIPYLITNAVEITQAQYDALVDKTGTYIITDAESVPLSAAGVSYSNTSSGLAATNAQTAIDEVNSKTSDLNTFALDHTAWAAYSVTGQPYTYTYTVTTSVYANTVAPPIWDLLGTGTNPGLLTQDEMDSANMILVADFDTSAITLYATDAPTVDLVLRVRGV